MNLFQVSIIASPDGDLIQRRTYTWSAGHPVEALEKAVGVLQRHLESLKHPAPIDATDTIKPIEIGDVQTPT